MSHPIHNLKKQIIAMLAGMMMTATLVAAPIDSRFDPNDYTTDAAANGNLVLTSGDTITFNTDALTYSGTFSGVGSTATSQSGNVELGMFTFNSLDIGTGVTVNVTGNRGLVLGSLNSISVASAIDVSGTNASGSSSIGVGGPGAEGGNRAGTFNASPPPANAGNGGGAGGTGRGVGAGRSQGQRGEGGSYGGQGTVNNGDVTYGDTLLTDLLGGSGGGGGNAGMGHGRGRGGGGGGSLELTALDEITIIDSLLAGGGNGGNVGGNVMMETRRGGGGGSGGAILLNAPSLVLHPGAMFDVGGGNHGNGYMNVDGGGGSGGRVAIYTNTIVDNMGMEISDISPFTDVSPGSKGNNSFSTPQAGTLSINLESFAVAEPGSLIIWATIAVFAVVLGWRWRQTPKPVPPPME